ncbi:unnamed protein product, partial [Meganyctiphanes norvegica]
MERGLKLMNLNKVYNQGFEELDIIVKDIKEMSNHLPERNPSIGRENSPTTECRVRLSSASLSTVSISTPSHSIDLTSPSTSTDTSTYSPYKSSPSSELPLHGAISYDLPQWHTVCNTSPIILCPLHGARIASNETTGKSLVEKVLDSQSTELFPVEMPSSPINLSEYQASIGTEIKLRKPSATSLRRSKSKPEGPSPCIIPRDRSGHKTKACGLRRSSSQPQGPNPCLVPRTGNIRRSGVGSTIKRYVNLIRSRSAVSSRERPKYTEHISPGQRTDVSRPISL